MKSQLNQDLSFSRKRRLHYIPIECQSYYSMETDRSQMSLFLWAVQCEYVRLVKLIMDEEIRISGEHCQPFTPLGYASSLGNEPLVRLLLGRDKFNVRSVDEFGRTALACAAFGGHDKIIQMLLDRGANVNPTDHFVESPLIFAAEQGYDNIVQLLLDRGAEVNANVYGRLMKGTVLKYAVNQGHDRIVQLLLERGADVNLDPGRGECAPLHSAARQGQDKIARLLIDRGADVNNTCLYNNIITPIHCAAEQGHHQLVRLLLEGGARVDFKDSLGYTAYMKAVIEGYEAVTTLLLEQGADPEETTHEG